MLLLTVTLCLLCVSGMADDILKTRIDSVAYIETEKSYLVLQCELPEEADVMLSVTDEAGKLVYQRNYGVCSGMFTSESIYLKMNDQSSSFDVYLSAGNTSYNLTVHRIVQRLKDNTACSVGYPLSALNGRDTWQTVTFLNRNSLSSGAMTVPLFASGNRTLGSVTFRLSGNSLYTEASILPEAECEVSSNSVSIAASREEIESLGTGHFTGRTGHLGASIDWPGSDIIAVLVRLTVSYNPSALGGSPQTQLSGQSNLWQSLQGSW